MKKKIFLNPSNFAKQMIMLIILLIFTIILSLKFGRYSIALNDIFEAFGFSSEYKSEDLSMVKFILFENRLPRILIAVLVGAGLATVGSSLQGIFQNPLVSPDIIGVSAGSGFGAALGILLSHNTGLLTVILSFVFGLAGLLSTILIVKARRQVQIMSYVLGGIITTSIFSALTSLIKYVADSDDELPSIVFWLMGSFVNKNWTDFLLIVFPILIGVIGLVMIRWRLNILSLGDEEALSLGINPKNTRVLVIILSTIITASCVMVSGIIGWVGLLVPHISRQIFGVSHEKLILSSAFVGAIFMVFVDALARTLTAAEIPIGILTALIGAPFFAYIFVSMKGEY